MAVLSLQNLIPSPLADRNRDASAIWEKQLTLEGNGIYHLRAPSGTGKSTLAHLLYGLRMDYTGDYLIDGKSARNHTLDEWGRLRQHTFSIIFQDLKLLPRLSAMDNLLLKAYLYPGNHRPEIDAMAERLGVKALLPKPVHTLSQGERQRIAIIRALLQPFRWLIADEPFSHLDSANRQAALTLMAESVTKNKAGLLCFQLEDDNYFNYHEKWQL